MTSAILLFALDDLRARFVGAATPGRDPRSDTAPFRAFCGALLPAIAAVAAPAQVRFWWEGSYNGYALAIAVSPADPGAGATGGAAGEPVARLEALEAAADPACPVDASREGVPPPRAHRLALLVAPDRWERWPEDDGAVYEAPFGAPTGHFGAPGLRRRT